MAKYKGHGLFSSMSGQSGSNTTDAKSDFRTYMMTPKYADPYAADNERRLAKLFISSDLLSVITNSNAPKNSQETKAILSKLGQSSGNIPIGYFDFFIQGIDETFDEKFQIVETLGDSYAVFGIGKKPKIFNCAGILLNTVENDWRVNFIRMFENYISISMMAKFRKANVKNIVTLSYDSILAEGAILSLRTSMAAGNEMACPFSFSMLVTKLDATPSDTVPTPQQNSFIQETSYAPAVMDVQVDAANTVNPTKTIKKTSNNGAPA